MRLLTSLCVVVVMLASVVSSPSVAASGVEATSAPLAVAPGGYGDVDEGSWYADAVQWSVDNNITG